MIKFDLDKVKFSYRDKEKGITIPKYLTPELAEDIGIHIGDGSLYRCNSKKSSSEFKYSSNIHERDYLLYIINLKKKLYNLQKFRFVRRREKELYFIFNSLAIATFYNYVLDMPIGSKVYTCNIPNIIKRSNNKKIIASCVKGIVDTDFYFYLHKRNSYFYPILRGNFASSNLVKDLSKMLNFLGIKHRVQFYKPRPDKRFKKSWLSNIIVISGHKEISKYIKIIGFSNPKNIKKIKKWARGDLNPRPLADIFSGCLSLSVI